MGYVQKLGELVSTIGDDFRFDNSDEICATYIIDRLAAAKSGTVVVIDYLQILDQKREHPPIAVQVQCIKEFARKSGITLVFISQIDRSFDRSGQPLPSLSDVRLPNSLDLTQFDKACFLNNRGIQMSAIERNVIQ